MKILLLGNGANRLNNSGLSWKEVIFKLLHFSRTKDIWKDIDIKPFPLVYEAMVLRYMRETKKNERDLKNYLSSLLKNMVHNNLHETIVNCDFEHILTTNYDYCLENASTGSYEIADLSREIKYNLFRRRKCANKFIWHIHGEIDKPQSITLGHDHYSGYLWRIKDYLINESLLFSKKLHNDKRKEIFSWVDLFLKNDVHIVGLSLDYSEIALWWLIIHKEHLKFQNKTKGKTVFYYCYETAIPEYDSAKLSLMESYGIDTERKECINGYEQSYNSILNIILGGK
jgi:hypothetical protein